MAEYRLPLTAEGAVTAPTGTLEFVEPSAESVTYLDIGEANVLEVPDFGWAVADGVNPLRLITRGSVYDCGGVAPNAAPTLAVTGGVRATATLTYTGQPSDGDYFWMGGTNTAVVYFRTTLLVDGSGGHQVKIGADDDTTYTNLQKLINGASASTPGTQGTEFFNHYTYLGEEDDYAERIKIECSALSTAGAGGSITFRWVEYGTEGNAAQLFESVANCTASGANFASGADGTGTAPAKGTYRYFYTWFRSADGAETGRSQIATITKQTNANIDVTVTASADTTFDYVNIYRTTKEGVEFRLCATTPRATLTVTDSMADTTLTSQQLWNEELYPDYTEGKPPRGRALAYWKGAIWTTGAHLSAEDSRGTVAVTKGSATVTFSALGIGKFAVGKTFRVASTGVDYKIISVSEAGPTAVLDELYKGATNGSASYTIRDAYDANAVRACVPFKYNQWPETYSPGRVETDDWEGGTALLATQSRLFAFSKTSIVAITGDDIESWDMTQVSSGIGCVAPRMCVPVEGGGVFLSYDGFYSIGPDGSFFCISETKAQRGMLATGITGTVNRINWEHVSQGYAEYDPSERVVIFGVPLDGATVPNYEIVFDLQNSLWTLYKRSEWTALARVTLPGGTQAMISGDRDGNIWHVGIGASDGFYGTEAVQTLTAATVRTLTVSGTPFSTTGDAEDGKPVLILSADGETVSYGKVASNTSSVLTLAEDLDTAPAVGDQIILGGIAWQAKSGYTTFGEEYRRKNLRSVTIRHAPTTRGDYWLSFAVDDGGFQLCPVGSSRGELSDSTGKIRHMVQWPGDSHSINIRGFKPGGRAVLRGGMFDIILRELGS